MVEEQIERGLTAHLAQFHGRVADGATRLGWKVAFNAPAIQQKLGLPYSLVAGLTAATRRPSGTAFSLADAKRPAAEAEVAVWLGADLAPDASTEEVVRAISAWAPAIEIVDFDRDLGELEQVLTEGVFHRAVILGEPVVPAFGADLAGMLACVTYGGNVLCEVDARAATGHAPEVVRHLARLLGRFGARLCAGDVLILGAMQPLTLAASQVFSLELRGVGVVSAQFT